MTKIRCFNINCIHNITERCDAKFILIGSLNQQCDAFFDRKDLINEKQKKEYNERQQKGV